MGTCRDLIMSSSKEYSEIISELNQAVENINGFDDIDDEEIYIDDFIQGCIKAARRASVIDGSFSFDISKIDEPNIIIDMGFQLLEKGVAIN